MSKIGKKAISLPSGVSIVARDNVFVVSGPKGEVTVPHHESIDYSLVDNELSLTGNNPDDTAMRGTTSSLIRNAVVGVSEGYARSLQVLGVGFTVKVEGQSLLLQLGYSHPIVFPLPAGIAVDVQKDAKGNPVINLQAIDKFLIGKVAADIRSLRKPEPYKGKGIRYMGEVVKMKAGKSAKKGK